MATEELNQHEAEANLESLINSISVRLTHGATKYEFDKFKTGERAVLFVLNKTGELVIGTDDSHTKILHDMGLEKDSDGAIRGEAVKSSTEGLTVGDYHIGKQMLGLNERQYERLLDAVRNKISDFLMGNEIL